ncbi:Response regulator receiver domain-containing protein [Dyadobacter soli]|uniref:Response regulator receiver domain-containing protein n=2 Tax=Dyadobacter soli TaxID=659014 RepID=A0A1G7GA54_9BACT|nr:Response regulator receiver domain-containing protein [Dyadobacter soli]
MVVFFKSPDSLPYNPIMKRKILIVEDLFVEANHLRIMLKRAGYEVTGIARTYEEAVSLIQQDRPGIVLLDIFLAGKKTGIDLASVLNQQHIPFLYLSANSNEEVLKEAKATRPSGFIVKPFREKDLLVSLEIAEYLHENSSESQLKREVDFQVEVKQLMKNEHEWSGRVLGIVKALQKLISFDYAAVGCIGEHFLPFNALHFLRTGFDDYQVMDSEGLRTVWNITKGEFDALMKATPIDPRTQFYNGERFREIAAANSIRKMIATKFGMRSNLVMPYPGITIDNKFFFISLYSRRPDAFSENDLELCDRIQVPLERLVKEMTSETPAPFPQVRLGQSVGIVAGNRDAENTFKGMIGQSHLLLNVFNLINQVAATDTSVLITGESGTGKERVADNVHSLSSRRTKPFVKVNCAALPISLIESELFGHEKGAFTGATTRRIGRFEQANGGTIFLDEIGDMPVEIQMKLLRVLQQREIERLGGTETIRIDIRVIAATNRDLERAIAEGKFRLDLYYRLNVFPILMPSLRERRDDIPLLVNHFIGYFSRKIGKAITGVTEKVLKALMEYDWPGNIRELENVIERSVLLARGNTIDQVSLPTNNTPRDEPNTSDTTFKNIFENERDHIIAVLKACEGRISGENGAAKVLAIPATTLGSKMKKLGIKREIGVS